MSIYWDINHFSITDMNTFQDLDNYFIEYLYKGQL